MTTDMHIESNAESGRWADIGLDTTAVELLPASAHWSECFAEEASRVTSACGDLLVAIEHVGGTAIAGLPCRPIIDILVGVDHLRDASGCIDPLKESGFRCHGENGVAGRRYFTRSIDRQCIVQLHMVQFDGEFWQNAIRFRDLLHDDSNLAGEYAKAKVEMQSQYSADPAAYDAARLAFEQEALI